MSKKIIWAIVGLMMVALLGSIWLQVNWITSAVELNEAQFDNNVILALNNVAERLEYEEQLEAYGYSKNGYAQQYYQQKFRSNSEGNVDIAASFYMEQEIPEGKQLTRTELMREMLGDTDSLCSCTECVAKRAKTFDSFMNYGQGLVNAAVADRIKLDVLDIALREELGNKGVDIAYSYGVYDRKKKSFVIANNYYVVEDNNAQVTIDGYKNLPSSPYRVSLFTRNNGKSPGLLMIYFPTRSSVVWSSVWQPLLGAILFTGIILFCFIYTVMVVFRQKKVSEMKTDFINNMTHEFKTPIATISLASDSITSPKISGNPDKVKRFANIIRQENRRMNAQVEKVLQMARLDREDFELKMVPINLHDIIHSAHENIGLRIERRDGKMTANMDAEKPVIEGDMTHVSNMINNLLDNAEKYSPENPEISITTRNVKGGCEVIIADKGIGMTKESKKHIFDKFYRVHTGNRHDVKGFGLGLSYVKALITAHKGDISVKSELGKGSTFTLFFPFKQGQ